MSYTMVAVNMKIVLCVCPFSVSGQYLGSFAQFLVVFGQKKTDWTAQSVMQIVDI